MEVRAASPADAEEIWEVHRASWMAAYDDILSDRELARLRSGDTGISADDIAAATAADDVCYLVAVDGDAVVGFLVARWDAASVPTYVHPEDGEAFLQAIYLLPVYWGEEIGGDLLWAAVERLPPTVEVLKLEVFAENTIGRRFYDKHGFKTVAERTATPDEIEMLQESYPAVVMEKQIG